MRQNYIKDRREFLKASLCIPGVYGLKILSNTRDDYVRDKYYLASIIQVMKEEGARYNCLMPIEQINNLAYAFNKIKPALHEEMAFVVACCMAPHSLKYAVDEYSRRKNGKQSKGPDHPILALEEWCVPNTRRILIFKEQMQALWGEVTNRPPLSMMRLWQEVNNKTIGLNDFHELLTEKYRNQLSKDEVKIIYEAISYIPSGFRPYTWCATIVSRADALVKTLISYEKTLGWRAECSL